MHFPGLWLLLEGLLVSILISNPADAIDLDISDERTPYHLDTVPTGVSIALMDFARQNLSETPPAQLSMR